MGNVVETEQSEQPEDQPQAGVTDLFGNSEQEGEETELDPDAPEIELRQKRWREVSMDLCYDVTGMAQVLMGRIRGLKKLPPTSAAAIMSDLAAVVKKMDDIEKKVSK